MGDTPPPPSTAAQLSFFAQPRLSKDLSLRGGLPSSSATDLCLRFGGWTGLSLRLAKLSIFLSFSFIAMSRELRICPGVGTRKCGAFLSTLDRDPHPTCSRCRGRICTRDMTCDICADWFAAQWELFVKKRSYQGRKKPSRPSGSVPPALLASPRAETPSGVSQPGTASSSFSCPSGGYDKDAPGVVSRGGGGGGSLDSRLLRSSALPPLQLLRELGMGGLLGRSGLPLPAPLPRLPLPVPRRTFNDVGN